MHLLKWLHLLAVGDRLSYGFLVTLGGCHHLDGLKQQRSIGMCWWLLVAISWWFVRGLVPSPAESQKITLVDCSCHWVNSLAVRFLRCPIVWTRFMQYLLAIEPPSVGRHNGDQHASKHVNLRRKILCVLCDWISPGDWIVFILWLVHSSMRRYNHHTHSFTFLTN